MGLEQDALAATVLAVRRDPRAREAVEACRRRLREVQEDGQRSALLLGWGCLALDDPESAWEFLRAATAYGTEPVATGRAALLAGLISYRIGPPINAMAAWSKADSEVAAVLDEVDFTRDLATQLTDELIWPDRPEVRPGDPVLAPFLTTFDAADRSRVALGLHLLHYLSDGLESAQRALRQVIAIGHPNFVGPAWLAMAGLLVESRDKPAAAEACRQAIATSTTGQQGYTVLLGAEEGPLIDVPTQAKILLGVLQREAGAIEDSLATLTDAAQGDRPEAIFALAQTHQKVGDFAAARELYLTIADRESVEREQTIYNLGLLAKELRDLPEGKRWFGRYVEGGYDRAALAAAHLGELCYWEGDKEASLHWYAYTLANTEVTELVEEAEQRTAELLA